MPPIPRALLRFSLVLCFTLSAGWLPAAAKAPAGSPDPAGTQVPPAAPSPTATPSASPTAEAQGGTPAPLGGTAAPLPALDPGAARQAALDRLAREAAAGHAPGWQGAGLGDTVPLYDLTGAASAYLFPVQRGGAAAGYLTVAAQALPNPVLEYATEGTTPLQPAAAGAQALAGQRGYRLLDASRPLYLGLLSYAFEVVPADAAQGAGAGRTVLDLMDSSVHTMAADKAARPLWQQAGPATAPAPATPQAPAVSGDAAPAGSAGPAAYATISGVPDWNQFQATYEGYANCWSGCSPTASSDVVGYWYLHGFPNLMTGADDASVRNTVSALRSYMGTQCGGAGQASWTNIGQISPGISAYAQARGYGFTSDFWCATCGTTPTFDHFRSEIDAGRPIIIDLINSAQYGSHTITGMGYNTNGSYMTVHDNWAPSGDVNLQYGTGYSEIYMHRVVPPQAISGWVAEYFNSTDLSGGSVLTRGEDGTYVLRNWGYNGPGGAVGADNWSARFTRTLYFPGGNYQFHCQHDDGCRIYLDGNLAVNGWRIAGFAGDDWYGPVPAGNHQVRIEYFEGGGDARLEAWWKGPGYLPLDGACSANQWCARYFGNTDLAGTALLVRNEGWTLEHEWGNDAPVASMPSDGFSSQYARMAAMCGTYAFHAHADDGIRFWLDGNLVLDQWQDQSGTWDVTLDVPLGTHSLVVQQYEDGGGSGVGLSWQSLSPCRANRNMVYLPLVKR